MTTLVLMAVMRCVCGGPVRAGTIHTRWPAVDTRPSGKRRLPMSVDVVGPDLQSPFNDLPWLPRPPHSWELGPFHHGPRPRAEYGRRGGGTCVCTQIQDAYHNSLHALCIHYLLHSSQVFSVPCTDGGPMVRPAPDEAYAMNLPRVPKQRCQPVSSLKMMTPPLPGNLQAHMVCGNDESGMRWPPRCSGHHQPL